MGKLWSAKEVAELIGITTETLKAWEAKNFIPAAGRQGLRRKRIWSEWKLERILEFARDNGYPIKEQLG